jgi:hypothetical protein
VWLKGWGLKSSRAQAHTFETVAGPIQEIQKKFPTTGAETMRHHLRHNFKIRVPRCALVFAPPYSLTDSSFRELILKYNRETDPVAVAARKAGRIRRRIFHAAGVNHIWAFDQHDKWQRFGLRLHLGIEPFTGFLLWLIVWWTNSNPKLVGREYFQAARKYGGMSPLISCHYRHKFTHVKQEYQC